MSIEIVPTILTADIDDFEDRLQVVENLTERVQIDYVDGFFAPEMTCCEAHVIREVHTNAMLEVQLMVVDPIKQVKAWADAGVDRIIGHIEEMEDQTAFVEKVSDLGLSVGLALNLETPLDKLNYRLLPSLDVVLLMSHEVGIGGVALNDAIYERITHLRDLNEEIDIEIDGGVDETNAADLVRAGATMLAVGSYIFDHENPAQAIETLRKITNEL
jgi:ribulose-phosphate 3-epimerase